jgi:DNA-binding GntR family transcriptional regulator
MSRAELDGSGDGRLVPAPNRTLTKLAANEIRRRILSGEIRAGEKIQAAGIAQDLGISAVPVREALQALQGEGLVAIIGHRGAIAAPASTKELAELYQLREVLEPAAVAAVDLNLLQERLDTLVVSLEGLEVALRTGDRDGFRDAHRDFHFGIYACAKNDWMLKIIRTLYDNCERYRTLATWRRDPSEAGHEHRALLEALRQAKPVEAAHLTLAHLEVTRVAALSSITDDEADDTHGRHPE